MLVIGHRGAAGLARENSLEALRAGYEAGADILEFDVRLTKDKIPVLIHDSIIRAHHNTSIISRLTLEDLRARTSEQPVTLLSSVLDIYFGKILLNIELKGRGTGKVVTTLLEKRYVGSVHEWDNILLSSFRANELASVRRMSKKANLGLLHKQNPFIFIAYHRRLNLTAIGFHRLYINTFALEIAKRMKLFVYVYTVNRPQNVRLLARQGIEGIVCDNPIVILKEIENYSD